MGFGSLIREVVTEYSADVSEHVAALKELEGAEAELAAVELEQAEARQEQSEGFVSSLGKIAIAVLAVKEIGDVVWDGYKEGLKEAQLSSAAAGVDIEALSQAAGGLKTNMELLEFAAKANSSAFHNSQEDMQTAEEAMRALEARGVPAEQAFDAVTGAMDNLKTKGLQSLGIYVDTTKTSFDANGEVVGNYNQKLELHQKVMEALKVTALDVADGQDKLGDSMKRSQVTLSDSWAELKKGLGELAESMQPLLDALSKAVGFIAGIAKDRGSFHGSELESDLGLDDDTFYRGAALGHYGDGPGELGGIDTVDAGPGQSGDSQVIATVMNSFAQANATAAKKAAATAKIQQPPPDIEMPEMNLSHDAKADREAYADALARQLLKSAYLESSDSNIADTIADTGGGSVYDAKTGKLNTVRGKSSADLGTAYTPYNVGLNQTTGKYSDTTDASGLPVDAIAQLHQQQEAAQKAAYAQNETMLQKTFGKVGDFDLYKKGFEALTSSVGTMYDAIVTGSEPAATAIKKAIGASVEAVGKQMAVEALKEGAYALGDLAIGNFEGAASHATAAAEFAAGAVVAGVVARELGAGSSNTASSSGGSSSSSSSSSTGSTGSSSSTSSSSTGATGPVIVYGDSFADDSPRMRQIKAQKLVNLALGSSSAGTSS